MTTATKYAYERLQEQLNDHADLQMYGPDLLIQDVQTVLAEVARLQSQLDDARAALDQAVGAALIDRAKRHSEERAAFHRGMLAALQHVASADFETLYREIVESTDVDELVQVAREDGQMTMSGLKRYGYGKARREPTP